ncbi:metallophosphoesterase [Allopusillimonas ginsengisoli]|uniref:metallophosphoesterase n=1 Tax=Allopusillimonas ginsengisoli TaxID=453575 RepID=UPI001021DFBD|nr:metallophosphoesterase [Allopusillimonas ginsengisoli]TEA78593.1 metallophosphoesterase [Allopusillimonas ginsengisoli]
MSRFSFLLRLPVIVGLAHLYVALRLVPAAPTLASRWVVAAAILLIYLLIMGGFHTRRAVGRTRGDLMAWAGFLALGFFAWLFVLCLLRELFLAAIAVAQLSGLAELAQASSRELASDPVNAASLPALLRTGMVHMFNSSATLSAIAVIMLALAAVLLGLFNSRRTAEVVRVDVPLAGLPPQFDGYTIAQLSDVHVGPTIKRGYVQAIVDRTNALQADAIVLTGDLIDGSVERLWDDVTPLGQLKARDGVFAVTGNHEYYSGAQLWVDAFRRLGMTVLMNEHRVIARGEATLLMAGVTDYGAGAFDRNQASDPAAALGGASTDTGTRILLAHQPRSAPAAAAAGFDLQLSGHTHGGQFWPWKYFVPIQQPFVAGLHRQGKMMVYVSRGTGYWGPPMRIGARSEITLLQLRCA